ncbi:MAG: CHAP domain-containing protein [Sandaracinaceae bacterium]
MRSGWLFLLAWSFALPAQAQRDPCADVSCSGLGECFEENGRAHCLCDAGYAELSLACMPAPGDEALLRARHVTDVGARVVALAAREVSRKRWRVGEDADDGFEPLTDYLEPLEWWCGDFVSWIYARAGTPLSGGSSGGWLVTDNRAIAAWHEQRGLFVDRRHPDWDTWVPRPGDFVRFRTDRYGHAAIVERVVGDTLHTIEGNVANAVTRETYYHFRRNRLIEGFGRLELDDAPPSVDAGSDVETLLGEPVVLRGSAEDDGPLEALLVRWSTPDGVTLDDGASPITRARFAGPGVYELALHADDGTRERIDRVRVTVRRPPEPEPEPEPEPLADASGGCLAAPGARPAWLGALLLLAFARRRR